MPVLYPYSTTATPVKCQYNSLFVAQSRYSASAVAVQFECWTSTGLVHNWSRTSLHEYRTSTGLEEDEYRSTGLVQDSHDHYRTSTGLAQDEFRTSIGRVHG